MFYWKIVLEKILLLVYLVVWIIQRNNRRFPWGLILVDVQRPFRRQFGQIGVMHNHPEQLWHGFVASVKMIF